MASAVLTGSYERYYWSDNNIPAVPYMKNYENAADYDPDSRRRLVPNNPNPNRANANAAPSPPSTSFSNSSDHRKFVTFHLSSYSRIELIQLRKRLISELDQVRSVRTRIESLPESRPQINLVPPPAGPGPKKIKSIQKETTVMPPLSSLSMPQVSKIKANMMRKCSQMLNKLMKHKHGWVFNKPVDAASLGLHDYHTIIRKPMDLGTVKLRMSKQGYKTPLDFAGDVRLTFKNAMLYNPKGQDVYLMAHDLLTLFDNMFNPAFHNYESEIFGLSKEKQMGIDQPRVGKVGSGTKLGGEGEKAKGSKRDLNGKEKSRKRDLREEKMRKRDKLAVNIEAESRGVDMIVEAESRKVGMNVEAESRKVEFSKKEMSFEEKTRLAIGLQELPQPKLDEMVKIIKKRNMHLAPDCDEIEMELDIEVIDNETLWELDRLVKDNEKMVEGSSNGEVSAAQHGLLSGLNSEEQKNKKGDAGDEEVDIGDEGPVNFPPLEIEKDESSIGSSSDSSSFSDSDSSGSNSDGESVHSPFVQAGGEDPEMA